MISNKNRDTRRSRLFKMSKNLQRLYKEGKCAECSVVVTRMNFAKILGKFTKVKIQYESSSTPKSKRTTQQVKSPNSRLKSNENGMVLIHRNAYNKHPVKEPINTKKIKLNEASTTPRQANHVLKENSKTLNSNILRENNRLKKMPILKERTSNYNNNKIFDNSNLKEYGIIFVNPNNIINDFQNKLSLTELLPCINKNLLPSEEWCIDYFPKEDEPKDDKVYDRIAAELEDLMYNEKPTLKSNTKLESIEVKTDEFPSILDILNDSTNNTEPTDKLTHQNNNSDFKSSLESSDVEAMLLGKSEESKKGSEHTAMEVDHTVVGNLIEDVVQLNAVPAGNEISNASNADEIENPQSPSILDETLQKGIEEHLPSEQINKDNPLNSDNGKTENGSEPNIAMELDEKKDTNTTVKIEDEQNGDSTKPNLNTVTHVVFRKSSNGKCHKSVTCPKNLKYTIELEGKSIELLGAPKHITSLEDLQVLLQIVDESDLDSLYVLH